MKLRIKGNSIRMRLLRSEIEGFATDGRIGGETGFGASVLRYSLQTSGEAESVRAHFDNNEIVIIVPDALARDWTTSEMVGFDVEQPIGNGGVLSILIEKDFVCLDRPDDPDRADAYPNPSLECDPV
jgi:hypothetical protein